MRAKFTIFYKLMGLVSLTSVCVVGVGLLSIVSLKRIAGNFNHLVTEHFPQIEVTQQILLKMEAANNSIASTLTAQNNEEIRQSEANFNSDILQFEMFLNALSFGSKSDAFKNINGGILFAEWVRQGLDQKYSFQPGSNEQTRVLEEINNHIDDLVSNSQQIFALRKKEFRLDPHTDTDEITASRNQITQFVESIKTQRETIGQQLQQSLALISKDLNADIASQQKEINLISQIIIAVSGLNLLLVFGFGTIYIKKVVLAPINKLTHVVNDISTGKLDSKIDPIVLEANDEIGKLARAFDRTVVSLKLAMKEQTPPKDK